MVSEEDLTENFDVESPVMAMVKEISMWVELFIMLICPLPIPGMHNKIVIMNSINWVDNSGLYDAQSHEYPTPYLLNDFVLACMFFRSIFFAKAIMNFAPVNERLYGKRVCKNAGFEPKFGFQLQSVMRDYAIATFLMMSLILIMSMTYVTRIFERPYYTFNFQAAEPPVVFENFQTF